MSHYIAEGQANDTSKKALGTIQILRKGIPFIYQGQEIGMENQIFESVEAFDDIATINGYHVAKEAGLSEEEALAAIAKYSRDNARTPMQWSAEPGLGLSDGSAWLISPKTRCCHQCGRSGKGSKFYLELLSPVDGLVSPSPLWKYHPIWRYDPSVSGP